MLCCQAWPYHLTIFQLWFKHFYSLPWTPGIADIENPACFLPCLATCPIQEPRAPLRTGLWGYGTWGRRSGFSRGVSQLATSHPLFTSSVVFTWFGWHQISKKLELICLVSRDLGTP